MTDRIKNALIANAINLLNVVVIFFIDFHWHTLQARRIVAGPKAIISEFAEMQVESKDKLFTEFNSLSVIYAQPVSVLCGRVCFFR